MYWLKLIDAEGHRLSAELSGHVSRGALNEDLARAYLESFRALTESLVRTNKAIEPIGLDFGTLKTIAVASKSSHEFFRSISQLLVDRLNEWGADANLAPNQAHAGPPLPSVGSHLPDIREGGIGFAASGKTEDGSMRPGGD